jgi:hypothetical protein
VINMQFYISDSNAFHNKSRIVQQRPEAFCALKYIFVNLVKTLHCTKRKLVKHCISLTEIQNFI